nr:hypothetical protein [Pirellula staleyi]
MSMVSPEQESERLELEQLLGYLNFSTGATDPQFLANLDHLFERSAAVAPIGTWREVGRRLRQKLVELSDTSPVFRNIDQASSVLELVWDFTLPSYLRFHGDLLFHQTHDSLFRPLFVGRVCEAVLRQGPPWADTERIIDGSIAALNDYIGYRPVAALESQKIEPYRKEFVRPVPLYVRGMGVAWGKEREVIQKALELLENTDEDLLREAAFQPQKLEELAFDPRAYDFDHPVNKRPNYHFGQWDPQQIDNSGHYSRFVVQQVTLDALMLRLEDTTDLPREELLVEAAAVLAGTILMASGVCGDGPGMYDSGTTLAKLLPRIARYRDQFYERLFTRIGGEHAARLREESQQKRQPFGGARQHLNAQLARRRASQLEHVHLARIFARMGHVKAARRQADVVPCASARMLCQIDCLLTTGHLACDAGDLEKANSLAPQIFRLLERGIQCGAILDPWNIIGFDAHFSLFPAMENSVRDHRADELVSLMDRLFAFYSRIWSEAAAVDRSDLCDNIRDIFQGVASWWHKFAVHEVSTVEAVDPLVLYRAAEGVADALHVWHRGGAAAGDVAFWAPHAAMFDSPKAYALVIDSLLARKDFVASMALLMSWLGEAERIGLERADSSFHDLGLRWFSEMTSLSTIDPSSPSDAQAAWDKARKFLDYLEANAESFWAVPQFKLGASGPKKHRRKDDHETTAGDEDDGENLFGSAYEGMVYRDSTDDGVQGPIFEQASTSHDELLIESKRVADRLSFLSTVVKLWKLAVVSPAFASVVRMQHDSPQLASRITAMERWRQQAIENREGLARLLATVRDYKIGAPAADHDSMVEYDRRRMTKESLLERIIATSVETADAARMLDAALSAVEASDQSPQLITAEMLPQVREDKLTAAVFASLLRRDVAAVHQNAEKLWENLSELPLLYVPLSKGGSPTEIVAVRIRQHAIQDLLAWLPRLGLWIETCQLLEVARKMERDHPVGPGAVTEFDELFKIGYRAMVESLVTSSKTWSREDRTRDEDSTSHPLVSCLEQLTESMLTSWLAHSRTLRLSVLERVHDKTMWKKVMEFIERFGSELFTQRFLNLGNIRAILHQGVASWLDAIASHDDGEGPEELLSALSSGLPKEEVAEQLALVLEAIVENYGEYRDYNSTTTQSDRGEMLYTLLDFLRLRTRYDRVCWNLKPVVLAHEILVRQGEESAARVWRKALTDRINDEASQYLVRLADLQKKYAMRMPTVADRLGERFIRPLAIDRIRALVAPAIDEARRGEASAPKFELLEHETEFLTREPTGVGLDVPAWLVALEEEVENVQRPAYQKRSDDDLAAFIPPVLLSLDQSRKQIEEWSTRTD